MTGVEHQALRACFDPPSLPRNVDYASLYWNCACRLPVLNLSAQNQHERDGAMLSDMQNVEALSRVIAQATAPAFLLGAVAAFTSILAVRMERIMDRSRALSAIPETDETRAHLKADIPRLRRRAQLVNRALFFAVASGVACASLLLVAFTCAFFDVRHEPGLAALFSAALLLLIACLITMAMEIKISLSALDHIA